MLPQNAATATATPTYSTRRRRSFGTGGLNTIGRGGGAGGRAGTDGRGEQVGHAVPDGLTSQHAGQIEKARKAGPRMVPPSYARGARRIPR